MSYQMTIPISASPDRVWSVLEDVESWPEWTGSMVSVSRLDQGPLRVGSEARIRQPQFPAAVWKVTELEPMTVFTWETRSPGIVTAGGHAIEADGAGGSKLTLRIDVNGPAAGLVGAVFGRLIRNYVGMEAEGLRRAAMAAAAGAGSSPGAELPVAAAERAAYKPTG